MDIISTPSPHRTEAATEDYWAQVQALREELLLLRPSPPRRRF
jgi:hypothetical protein